MQHRQPIPLGLDGNVNQKIEQIVKATYFYTGSGVTSSIKIARASFPVENTVENIEKCVQQIVKFMSNGWDDIHAIYIKSNDTLSIPLFVSLPVAKTRINVQSTNKDQIQTEDNDNEVTNQSEEEVEQEKEEVEQEEDTTDAPVSENKDNNDKSNKGGKKVNNSNINKKNNNNNNKKRVKRYMDAKLGSKKLKQ